MKDLSNLLRANGAVFIFSLGQRPRKLDVDVVSAEGAIHPWRALESRFQRCTTKYAHSWGAAPGCYDVAPLALPEYRLVRERNEIADGTRSWSYRS